MFGRVMLLSVVSLAMAPVVASAQHGEEQGKPAEFKMPTTYKAGVEEIDHRLDVISKLMEPKQLAKVHVEADVIQKVAKEIGQLALKDGSGVPKEAAKDINQAGKDLADKSDAIDKAAGAGDAAGTKKIYDDMLKIAVTLAKYAPKVYQCPMKCEREKTYDKPGKCPKCGMDLKSVKSHIDHEAERGGQ